MTVETILEDGRWKALGLDALAERAVDAALLQLGLQPSVWEISLLGCNDARIAELNADFREKPAATNVLSWPSVEREAKIPGEKPELPVVSGSGMPGELGDIAIAYETCKSEAEAADKPISAHVTHLLVHATLHLLGFDHISDEDAVLMESTEAEILAILGHEDPYRTE